MGKRQAETQKIETGLLEDYKQMYKKERVPSMVVPEDKT